VPIAANVPTTDAAAPIQLPGAGHASGKAEPGRSAVDHLDEPTPIEDPRRPATRTRAEPLLPAIEAVAARRLAPSDRGSDEPEQGKDHRHDPQDMEGETSPREDQHDEE